MRGRAARVQLKAENNGVMAAGEEARRTSIFLSERERALLGRGVDKVGLVSAEAPAGLVAESHA